MPKRIPETVPHPLPVVDLIQRWGKAIHSQRLIRKIPMRDFAHRINVSLNTLQRIEHGEHSVQAGTYLNAMMTLGIMDTLCPAPELSATYKKGQRVRKPASTDDNDYF